MRWRTKLLTYIDLKILIENGEKMKEKYFGYDRTFSFIIPCSLFKNLLNFINMIIFLIFMLWDLLGA